MNEKLNTKTDLEDIINHATYKYDFMTSPYNAKIIKDNKDEVILCLTTCRYSDEVDNTIRFRLYAENSNLIEVRYDRSQFRYIEDDWDETIDDTAFLLLAPETMLLSLNTLFMNKIYKLLDYKDANYIRAKITSMCITAMHKKIEHTEAKKHKKLGFKLV